MTDQSRNFQKSILVIDDEFASGALLEKTFSRDGWDVSVVTNGEEAIELLEDKQFSIIFLDLVLPGMSGLEFLMQMKMMRSEAAIIVITGFYSIDTAIEAMKLGAYDYVRKPIFPAELKMVVKKVIEDRFSKEVETSLTERLKLSGHFEGMIGHTKEMKEVFKLIQQCARKNVNILIQSETGTGKELVASAIHNLSPRKNKPYVIVDCASISESLMQSELFGHVKGAFSGAVSDKKGYIEVAHGGTLFLDEIGELPLNLQTKLLRFLQNRDFYRVGSSQKRTADVRVIAATNRDLQEEVSNGNFRQDLYTRLNVITISIPPLRRRIEDLHLLVDYFITRYFQGPANEKPVVSMEALRLLESYGWPGNIRELENEIRRALVLTDSHIIESRLFEHLPPSEPSPTDKLHFEENASYSDAKNQALTQFEKQFLLNLLRHHNGNISLAAREAEMSRSTLHSLLKKHDIDPNNYQ